MPILECQDSTLELECQESTFGYFQEFFCFYTEIKGLDSLAISGMLNTKVQT